MIRSYHCTERIKNVFCIPRSSVHRFYLLSRIQPPIFLSWLERIPEIILFR